MRPYSITPGTLIVALDIGKNVHWFGCYRYDGRPVELVAPQVESQPLDRDRLAVLLRYCSDPHQALALGADGLIQLFHEHGYRAGPHTAAAILRALRHSPLPPQPVAALYAQRLQADYRLYDALRQREAELTDQIAALVPATPARFLDSIAWLHRPPRWP
ncbi:MAG: hypothetical protein WHX53_13920 [Anaerolineae bacterium]